MHVEARLSRLARWVMLAEERGLRYGLKLSGRPSRSAKDSPPRALPQELALFHG